MIVLVDEVCKIRGRREGRGAEKGRQGELCYTLATHIEIMLLCDIPYSTNHFETLETLESLTRFCKNSVLHDSFT